MVDNVEFVWLIVALATDAILYLKFENVGVPAYYPRQPVRLLESVLFLRAAFGY